MTWLILAIAQAIRLGFVPWLVAFALMLFLLFDWLILIMFWRHWL